MIIGLLASRACTADTWNSPDTRDTPSLKLDLLDSGLNVRFATPGHIPGSEQKRTFTILHCEAVFNLVLKNNEPLQSFGNAKPLVNEMAAPFVHETCLYAVFEYEAMDRSL